MIQYNHTEISLEGLAERATPLVRPMGKLDIAENLEVRDVEGRGALCKTRGYRFIPMDNVVNRYNADALFTRVVNHGGRLVVFSYNYVTELGSRSEAMRGTDSMVYGGPANRGNVSIRIIAVSRTSRVVVEGG